MNGDEMLALIIGMIIGLIIVKGMVWLVMKAKSQSGVQMTRSSNGSIHIQAGAGKDLHITGDLTVDGDKSTVTVTDQYGCEYEWTPPDETVDLKKNLLD